MSIYTSVPDSLKDTPQWVVWKYETRDGKETKIPYNAKSNGNNSYAKVNDSTTWATFDCAAKVSDVLSGHDYNGVGFVLHGARFVGFDFDGVLLDGKAEPFVLDILQKLGNPYCEITPSGNGLRAFVEYPITLPAGKRKFSRNTNGKYGAEIYSGSEGGRYLTVTGNRFSGNGIPKILDISIAYFMVTQIANEKLKALWMGDLLAYDNDQSRADLALLGILARLFDNDTQKMEWAFTASKLGQRDKWAQRKDYRERTIAKAISGEEPKNESVEAPQSEIWEAEAAPEIIDEPLPEFPAITGSIQELAEALCPDIPREFKIMAAITRVGLAISGKVHLESELHLQPRFYTCFIAEPGRGKTAAIKETRIIDEGYREVPSVDSAPALVDTFAESNDSPRRLLLSPDEAVDLFEKAKTSRDSRNSLFTELLKLYEDNRTGNRARRNESPIEIDDAHLAIVCGATPSGYDGMWTGSKGASGGLQSRFLPIVSTAPQIPARQRASNLDRVRSAVERIRRQIETCGPTLITMTPEAEDAFKVWWESVPKDKPSAVRVEALVKRFLIVLAVTNDTDVIGFGLMTTGIAFGDYIITVRETYNPADASSWVHAFENKIVACHERAGVPITRNQCRRLLHPERHPGGFGDFIRAYGNVIQAGRLVPRGRTERDVKYALDSQNAG